MAAAATSWPVLLCQHGSQWPTPVTTGPRPPPPSRDGQASNLRSEGAPRRWLEAAQGRRGARPQGDHAAAAAVGHDRRRDVHHRRPCAPGRAGMWGWPTRRCTWPNASARTGSRRSAPVTPARPAAVAALLSRAAVFSLSRHRLLALATGADRPPPSTTVRLTRTVGVLWSATATSGGIAHGVDSTSWPEPPCGVAQLKRSRCGRAAMTLMLKPELRTALRSPVGIDSQPIQLTTTKVCRLRHYAAL